MDTKINEVKRIVFSLIDLYGNKDISGEELLKRYKEIIPTAGENYDKMLVVDYVKTKNVILNEIAWLVQKHVETLDETHIFKAGDLVEKYSTENLPELDIPNVSEFLKSLEFSNANEVTEELVVNFIGENYSRLKTAILALKNISNVEILKIDLEDLVKKFNTQTEIVSLFLKNINEELSKQNFPYLPDIEKCKEADTLSIRNESVDLKVDLPNIMSISLPIYKSLYNKLGNVTKDIGNTDEIFKGIIDAFGSIIKDYSDDLMGKEEYEFKMSHVKSLLTFYIDAYENFKCTYFSFLKTLEVHNLFFKDVIFVMEVTKNKIEEMDKK